MESAGSDKIGFIFPFFEKVQDAAHNSKQKFLKKSSLIIAPFYSPKSIRVADLRHIPLISTEFIEDNEEYHGKIETREIQPSSSTFCGINNSFEGCQRIPKFIFW